MNRNKWLALFTAVVLLACSAFACASARTLKKGMEGNDVLEAQTLLRSLSYYTGNLDGKFGDGTLSAVIRFQKSAGLNADGKIGPRTLAALNGGSVVVPDTSFKTLRLGDTGTRVSEVQDLLRGVYCYMESVDGIYSEGVRSAVRSFQALAGLSVDGAVGYNTYYALKNRTGRVFNGGVPVRSLSLGSMGYDVYAVQTRLKAQGFLTAEPSGYYDSATATAVRILQGRKNLAQNGNCTSAVYSVLWWGSSGGSTATASLRVGSRGSAVKDVQLHLRAGGYLSGKADGIYGEETRKAVLRFQKAKGLTADGVVGAKTLAAINQIGLNTATADPAFVPLRSGMSGSRVLELQRKLIALKYMSYDQDDGKFGVLTRDAIVAFQTDYDLPVDGVCGERTYDLINTLIGAGVV